jgi:hypothetical protein
LRRASESGNDSGSDHIKKQNEDERSEMKVDNLIERKGRELMMQG